MNANYCNQCGRQCHKDNETKVKVNASELGIKEVVICDTCKCDDCIKEMQNEL